MKSNITLLLSVLFLSLGQSQQTYQDYFTSEALRIDFFQIGDQHTISVIADEFFREDQWGGNPHNLLDTLNLGHYLLQVYQIPTNLLIYSYGYSTLFEEWQTTSEAATGAQKIIGGSVRIPFPRHRIRIEFLKRDNQNIFSEKVGSFLVDPESVDIRKEKRASGVTTVEIQRMGDPSSHVDLLILAEGYTAAESEKFSGDARRLIESFFQVEPFKKQRGLFNITAVLKPSLQSGIDDPTNNIYVNTPMNFSFNMFGSQRYLMTYDYKNLNDIASAFPFDALAVLVNTDIYGGGGVYNLYTCSSVDNRWSSNIFVHEMGHSFGGLGDEYYSSDVAYTDYYSKEVEPWEPNLTTLLDPSRLKWKQLVSPGTSIPTPWQKKEYDEENSRYSEKLIQLRAKDTEAEVKKFRKKHQDKIIEFFENHPCKNKVGAFEGAGYASEGIYRPALDCIMFSNRGLKFDPVCAAAIEKRIHFLTAQ